MCYLKVVLIFKIIFTAFFWSLPLLLFPGYAAKVLGVPGPTPILFARLLGAAFLALLVGYTHGLLDLNQGKDIRGVVWVGIVSNGLASALLLMSKREWDSWGKNARGFIWLSAVLTFLIAVGLVTFGLVLIGANCD